MMPRDDRCSKRSSVFSLYFAALEQQMLLVLSMTRPQVPALVLGELSDEASSDNDADLPSNF
ncbi:hypothetical protein CY34DRAFT_19381 [Suillus luteus UH-Slu-Lm8-n1]|uniref:Uncharacterized protein n=1 Tax=Suillus luteus UH-Slu-Lm8-n1 TaxID=930992 RepID=A0A0D0AJ98_9AGAM|nr:hypothetical protein CY34DRAFT_19381 [Suillus luteus UH-Slu-Lm8-n1]